MKCYDYKPLPDVFEIRPSDIHGYGIFTKKMMHATMFADNMTTHVIIDKEIIRTPLGGFLNHSNTPNCKLQLDNVYSNMGSDVTIAYAVLRPTRVILSDEELTLDYNQCYDTFGVKIDMPCYAMKEEGTVGNQVGDTATEPTVHNGWTTLDELWDEGYAEEREKYLIEMSKSRSPIDKYDERMDIEEVTKGLYLGAMDQYNKTLCEQAAYSGTSFIDDNLVQKGDVVDTPSPESFEYIEFNLGNGNELINYGELGKRFKDGISIEYTEPLIRQRKYPSVISFVDCFLTQEEYIGAPGGVADDIGSVDLRITDASDRLAKQIQEHIRYDESKQSKPTGNTGFKTKEIEDKNVDWFGNPIVTVSEVEEAVSEMVEEYERIVKPLDMVGDMNLADFKEWMSMSKYGIKGPYSFTQLVVIYEVILAAIEGTDKETYFLELLASTQKDNNNE